MTTVLFGIIGAGLCYYLWSIAKQVSKNINEVSDNDLG
jgi:hypothetical protein